MIASRIAPLDALRGLTALVVVLHHYYYFLAQHDAPPFEAALGWAYSFGMLAVPMFFMLSGYIFFQVYSRSLGEGRLSGRDFFWLRASRLYPLHVLTLLTVVGLQAACWRLTGKAFGFSNNDLPHFLLNVLFLQFSWVDDKFSFNGPAWSLSVEAGLYVAFFVFARTFGEAKAPRLAIGALCVGLAITRSLLPDTGPLNWHFARGLGFFFAGGCLQLTYAWPDRLRLAVGVVMIEAGLGLMYGAAGQLDSMICLNMLFGGLVLASLGSRTFARVAASFPFSWLGSISYSIYLWHYPVQIVMVLVSATMVPIGLETPVGLAIYLAATLSVSTLSYHGFEVPARAVVRRWAEGRALAPAVA